MAVSRVASGRASFLCRTLGPLCRALGPRRHIRTGFFPDDHDFINPEDPLLSEPLNARWRNLDDPTLRSSVLERSNVGMGMLVLNRANGLDLPCINELYKRLRNLEVNSLKRFVGLAAMEPGPFSIGLDPKELLLAAVDAKKRGELSRFSRALLWNCQELAHLVADYRKPLVCQVNGPARDAGAALACLSSFSGAYVDSEICVEACRHGLVPMGGMTYLLGSLRWQLGEFLALTGWRLRGADLVALDLLEHWLSPDALPFLELTSEKQLEMSESDAKLLLHEHSLPLPEEGDLYVAKASDPEVEGDSFKRRYIPLINDIFQYKTPHLILEALEEKIQKARGEDLEFLQECKERMQTTSLKASWITLELIGQARLLLTAEKNRVRMERPKAPSNQDVRPIHVEILLQSLRSELFAQQNLLKDEDVIPRLHAACTGGPSPGRSERDKAVTIEEIKKAAEPPKDFVFVVPERSEVSLSQHPRLRRYHPDYDPDTGLDHDPRWMKQEADRWDPNLFAEERRRAVEELLGGGDPSTFGLSRWVRVESRDAQGVR